ncbi:MAG TPA: XisH family protein [Microcoleus sp.]|nr:XisH family protein [Microcoleus sp.]
MSADPVVIGLRSVCWGRSNLCKIRGKGDRASAVAGLESGIGDRDWRWNFGMQGRSIDWVKMYKVKITKQAMPVKDIYHHAVKQALVNDGWLIVAENYVLEYGGDKLYPDIAAEKLIAAESQGRKILVQVKSFLGRSFINDLEGAVGKYIIYRNILQAQESEYELYLAIAARVYQDGFQKKLAKLIIETNRVKLLVFEPEGEVIERWIN